MQGFTRRGDSDAFGNKAFIANVWFVVENNSKRKGDVRSTDQTTQGRPPVSAHASLPWPNSRTDPPTGDVCTRQRKVGSHRCFIVLLRILNFSPVYFTVVGDLFRHKYWITSFPCWNSAEPACWSRLQWSAHIMKRLCRLRITVSRSDAYLFKQLVACHDVGHIKNLNIYESHVYELWFPDLNCWIFFKNFWLHDQHNSLCLWK